MTSPIPPRSAQPRNKPWVFVLGVTLVALGLVGHNAYGLFQPTATAPHATDLATVTVSVGGSNPEDNEFTIDAEGVVAGDQIQRTATINVGSVDLSSLTLKAEATTSSLLDTDTTNGLQIQVFGCDQPIDQTTVGGVPLLTGCSGNLNQEIASAPVIFGDTALPDALLTAGSHYYLAILLFLPADADNSFVGEQSVLRFTVTGIARAGHGQ